MDISDIKKINWYKGEEWFEKWYNTELEFMVFVKNANPLSKLFTDRGFNVLALNTQWFYDRNDVQWEKDRENAVKKVLKLLASLVPKTEKYIEEAEDIIKNVENLAAFDETTLSEFKRGFLMLWCVFLADLGKPLTPFIEEKLNRRDLSPRERDAVIDFFCFNFQHPLGFQQKERGLRKIYSLLPRELRNKTSLFSRVENKKISFKDLPEGIKKLLTVHWKKYSYLTDLYLNTRPYSLNDFFNELISFSSEKSPQHRKKLSEKIKNRLTKTDLKFLHLVNRHIFFDNYAYDLYAKLDFLLNMYLSKYFSVDTKDLTWYSFQDLESLVKNGVKLRKASLTARKHYRMMAQINGEITALYGKDNYQEVKRIVEKGRVLKKVSTFSGLVACRGFTRNKVKIIKDLKDIDKLLTGEILVAPMTQPDLILAIKRCSGIITDTGGITSHASIISREFNIPCIVGTDIATKVLKDEDTVELDANNGIVKIIEKKT